MASINWSDVAQWAGSFVGGSLFGAMAGKRSGSKGAAEGAAGALNGTAEAVRGLVATVSRIDTKLDQHIVSTNTHFTDLHAEVGETRERVATIEGQLSSPKPKPARSRR